MSYERLIPAPSGEVVPAISELSVVALRTSLPLDGGQALPAGAEGTVVATWGDGSGYVVEFDTPFHAVATVEADRLREVVRFIG